MILYDKTLPIEELEAVIFSGEKIGLAAAAEKRIEECYRFLESFAKDKVIYGINTGFGPMAQYRVSDEDLLQLQYNIIRSHSSGAGEPLEDIYVRAAMVARIGTLIQGYSGIHLSVVKLIIDFINNEIYPMIPRHGSVGASGDLVQLAHIALALIGEGKVHYKGQWRDSAEVMAELGLKPIEMHIREGLCITNGTSVMTGIGTVNAIYSRRLLSWAVAASCMVNEIVESYDDFMAEEINRIKRHEGQQKIAAAMRRMLSDSCSTRNRVKEMYSSSHAEISEFKQKVQPYYSLRCVPQILGPVYETLHNATQIVVDEVNSACDNPIVDPESRNIYHGGNFHGDYISLEMDKMKIAVTKLTMLMERQMNYLFHDRINGILPPFVNLGKLGLNYGLQAAQFTATSTTAECQTLSMPNSIHSIPNNNDNQDVVSMGTNSALITKTVIENSYQVMAIHFMAIVQAVDCLKARERLSSRSQEIYDSVRKIVPVFIEDTPKYEEIASMTEFLKNTKIETDIL